MRIKHDPVQGHDAGVCLFCGAGKRAAEKQRFISAELAIFREDDLEVQHARGTIGAVGFRHHRARDRSEADVTGVFAFVPVVESGEFVVRVCASHDVVDVAVETQCIKRALLSLCYIVP